MLFRSGGPRPHEEGGAGRLGTARGVSCVVGPGASISLSPFP
jgi:hypothetical protein